MEQRDYSRRERNCELCVHYRLRPRVHIRGTILVTPEVLKAESELQAEYDSLAQTEQYNLRFTPNMRFPEEPIAYPWCWMFTPYDSALLERIDEQLAERNWQSALEEARAGCERNKQILKQAAAGDADAEMELRAAQLVEIGYTTDTLRPYYALCRTINNDQRPCPLFEPKEAPALQPGRRRVIPIAD